MKGHFNLIEESWLPVITESGNREIIPIQDLARDLNRPIRFSWGRGDFDLASMELMIGIFSMLFLCKHPTSSKPAFLKDWRELYHNPLPPAVLQEKLNNFKDAFYLSHDDPETPLFCQERNDVGYDSWEEVPIERLLFGTAAKNAINNSTDLFCKERYLKSLSPPVAAIALYTLQNQTGDGGSGHYVSIRGGGPMVLLLDQELEQGKQTSLWQKILLNAIYPEKNILDIDQVSVFPWLQKFDGKLILPSTEMKPYATFFGMPRRIKLAIEKLDTDTYLCPFTNAMHSTITSTYLTKNKGRQYQSDSWRHHLTPYYKAKNTNQYLPKHCKSSAIYYKEWCNYSITKDQKETSKNITFYSQFLEEALTSKGDPAIKIVISGYSFKKTQPKEFTHSEAPLITLLDEAKNEGKDLIENMVKIAEDASRAFGNASTILGENPSDITRRFWIQSEVHFKNFLTKAQSALLSGIKNNNFEEEKAKFLSEWSKKIYDFSSSLYEEYHPITNATLNSNKANKAYGKLKQSKLGLPPAVVVRNIFIGTLYNKTIKQYPSIT